MRFVAGRGAVAELLAGAPWRNCWPGAMRQSAIGKMLLAWAPRRSCRPAWALQRRAIGKMLLIGAAAELLTGRYAVAKRLLAGGAMAE